MPWHLGVSFVNVFFLFGLSILLWSHWVYGFMVLLVAHVNIRGFDGFMDLSNYNIIYILLIIIQMRRWNTIIAPLLLITTDILSKYNMKAVMNKVSLNVLCLSLSFHICHCGWAQWSWGWNSMIGTWMSSLLWWVGILVVISMFDLFYVSSLSLTLTGL